MSNSKDKKLPVSTSKKGISKSMIQIDTLDGGAIESYKTGNKVFRSAYVTDTRLMGVLSIGITWYLPDNNFKYKFDQFFYIDVE